MLGRRLLLGGAAMIAGVAPARAQTDRKAAPPILGLKLNDMLAAGLKATGANVIIVEERGKRPVVTVEIDRETFIEAIPELQKKRYLNPEMGTAFINGHPFSLMMLYAHMVAPMIIDQLFTNEPRLDAITGRGAAAFGDLYGNEQHETLFTFDFNRDLHRKINWERFTSNNFHKVAPNYRTTPFMSRKFSEERSGE